MNCIVLCYEGNRLAYVHRIYVHSVAVYKKYLTRLGELIIFEPWREIIISPNRVRYF